MPIVACLVGGKDVNLWDEPAEGNIVRDAKTGAIRAGTLNQLVANLASQQRMGTAQCPSSVFVACRLWGSCETHMAHYTMHG